MDMKRGACLDFREKLAERLTLTAPSNPEEVERRDVLQCWMEFHARTCEDCRRVLEDAEIQFVKNDGPFLIRNYGGGQRQLEQARKFVDTFYNWRV